MHNPAPTPTPTPTSVLMCLCASRSRSLLSSAFNRQTVNDDVTARFENKSVEELAQQKTEIQDMLNSGEASVDSEFWEAVLKELHVFQVRAVLSLTEDVGKSHLLFLVSIDNFLICLLGCG